MVKHEKLTSIPREPLAIRIWNMAHVIWDAKYRIWNTESAGFSLIEVLLSGSILLLLLSAVLGAVVYGGEGSVASGDRTLAIFLAEEGLEALRNIKDSGFENLADGSWGLSSSTNTWSLSGSSDATGIFVRQVKISAIDTNRKHVTSTVNWEQSAIRSGSVSIATRFTNWARSAARWLAPRALTSLNFPGTQNALKLAVAGNYVYMILAGGTPDFVIIDISNPASPTILGSLSLPDVPQNIAVSGDFAYVSSQGDNQELQIINISNPNAPVLSGTYNALGTANATGVFAVGTTVYLLRISSFANEFLIINASVASSPTLVGSLNLGDSGREVVISGSFAYIAGGHNTQEFQVVDISNPAAPSLTASLNLLGTADALTIIHFGSTAIVGQGGLLRVIDVTNPAAPVLSATLGLGGTINDLALYSVDNSLVFAGTNNTTAEFQVINVSNLVSPILQSSANLSGSINGVAYQSTQDIVYAASGSNTEEFIVIVPQ